MNPTWARIVQEHFSRFSVVIKKYPDLGYIRAILGFYGFFLSFFTRKRALAFDGYLKSPPGYTIEPFSSSLTPPHSPNGLSHFSPVQFGAHEHVKESTPFEAHVAPFRHGLLEQGSDAT